MIFGMTPLVFVHVLISLVGLGAGFVVAAGMLSGRRLERSNAVFLWTTLATSLSGFILPAEHFMPSHAVGIVSVVVLAVALFAWYGRHLAGAWRRLYVVTALVALYLNVFVLIVQSFLKVPALRALAPTQSESPFQIAQLVTFALFVVLGFVATIRFGRGVARASEQQPINLPA
jgi:hypothetical protein